MQGNYAQTLTRAGMYVCVSRSTAVATFAFDDLLTASIVFLENQPSQSLSSRCHFPLTPLLPLAPLFPPAPPRSPSPTYFPGKHHQCLPPPPLWNSRWAGVRHTWNTEGRHLLTYKHELCNLPGKCKLWCTSLSPTLAAADRERAYAIKTLLCKHDSTSEVSVYTWVYASNIYYDIPNTYAK